MNFRNYLLLISLFISLGIQAQRQNSGDDKVIQFSGVVVTADSLKPIPFANIRIAGTNRGTHAGFYGFFSFVAHKGDSILFSYVGYRTSIYHISDTLSSDRYSLIQMMQTDTLLLTETVIYPWPTISALEYAIINHKVQENDYDRAMKNLAIEEMKERGEQMPMDGAMNYRYQMQQISNKAYYNGQYMPNQLLNPFAWAQFIKAWKEGKFKRKKKH